MTKLPFIAEIHDIGKLVDKASLGRIGINYPGHTFHNFDFSQLNISPPTSPSWWGQWSGSLKDLHAAGGLPRGITDDGKACVVLTNIADTLAASISRTLGGKGAVEEGVCLLWNPHFYRNARGQGRKWAAFQDRDELKDLFSFIDTCSGPQEFFARYSDHLLLTPEDKSTPLNFIPLRTHLDLTGKVFRVSRFHSRLIHKNGKPYLKYDGQEISQVQEAAGGRWDVKHRGKWIFRLVKCKVNFSQSIARLQDLNVFELRRRKIEEIVNNQNVDADPERQPYAVLFHTEDFLCLFLPREKYLSLRNALRPLWENGFWIECEELEAELNLLTSSGGRTRGQLQQKYPGDPMYGGRHLKLRNIAVWPNLDPHIEPPLCDLCQQRKGQEYVKDDLREWLCQSCRETRELGQPASVYAHWEEEEFPAAWIKVSLDQKLLLSCLQGLFEAYVDRGPAVDRLNTFEKQALKDGFRPLAAQMEFVREYVEFLEEFKKALENLTGSNRSLLLKPGETLLFPIPGYLELTIVRLDSSETLGAVLDAFVQSVRARFPECLEDCPIRLSVSMGNPKYPYQEHWRFFSEPQQPAMALCIQQPGVRQVTLTVSQYRALRDKLAGDRLGHFLHRLAAIEARAGDLTALVQALKQRPHFPQIHELIMFHGLGLRQILDFYRLIGFNMQHEETLRV